MSRSYNRWFSLPIILAVVSIGMVSLSTPAIAFTPNMSKTVIPEDSVQIEEPSVKEAVSIAMDA